MPADVGGSGVIARRDVENLILDRFDTFIRDGGELPATPDGKVNVAGLVRRLGLPPSDVQHFYKKDSIKLAVNAIAEDLSLAPIGARALSESGDGDLDERLAKASRQARKDARAAVEQSAATDAILAELSEARSEVTALRLERDGLRERLRLIEERGILWRP